MSSFRFPFFTSAAAVACLAFSSCSFGPPSVAQPPFDPSDVADAAIELCDANQDGKIAGDELDKSPSLKADLARLDTDKNGGITADEIAAAVQSWIDNRTALTTLRCKVTLDGQPHDGATVTFEPEPFMGDQIKPATGLTNYYGDASPTIAPEDLPDPTLGGIHFGFYKVKISDIRKGKETIPAQYNTETTLGEEVSYNSGTMKDCAIFDLKSK